MNQSILILIAIFFPVMWGIGMLIRPEFSSRKNLILTTGAGLLLTAVLALLVAFGNGMEMLVYSFGENMSLYFKVDDLGRMFTLVVTVAWVMVGFYAFEYMNHEKEEKRFFGFYLILFGVLLALDFAGNIITFYVFYEMMTLVSLPLVLHTGTKEAIMGGLKYLFYSLCGAYMSLLGIFFLNKYAVTLNFQANGVLDIGMAEADKGVLLVVVFFMILGFGVKAGMFPLHAWLPAAHPIAPAPASAVLSAIIVKMGVLGILRVVYYMFGAEFIRGTWVQTAWIILALITIFMGSTLAYREKIFKKRLAYSTVSQASYILFGMALLDPTALKGSLLHVVFHAVIKSALFMSAGAIIYKTGKIKVDELRGIGKEMPVTIWCYTFASLALIGIPPASGFISKWYLIVGALESGIRIVYWSGPVILLLSALLTAGYLLPITIHGFLPGADYDYPSLQKKEPAKVMVVPILIFACLAVLFGVIPNPLTEFITGIVNTVL